MPITLDPFRYFVWRTKLWMRIPVKLPITLGVSRYLYVISKNITYKELQNLSVDGRLAREDRAFDYGCAGLRIESRTYRYVTSNRRGLPLHDQ